MAAPVAVEPFRFEATYDTADAARRSESAYVRVPRFTSKITLRRHAGQMSHSRLRE